MHPSILPPRARPGATLVEMLIALVLISIILTVVYSMLWTGRRMEEGVGAHLGLQGDARIALVRVIRDLQEGIIVVSPEPGRTQSSAVIRDRLGRMLMYAVIPGPKPGTFLLERHLASPSGYEKQRVMDGIERITFTALSDAALMLHVVLVDGERRFPFHTEVRLRNRDAAATF